MKDWNDFFVDTFGTTEDLINVCYADYVEHNVDWFRVTKYNQPVSVRMIGTPEIEQALEAEDGAKRRAEKHVQHKTENGDYDLPKSDPGYPYTTIGELVQDMFRAAGNDEQKHKAISKWADMMRDILAGNLWGYNARRAAEEARAAKKDREEQQAKQEPERTPFHGEENLFVVADISKNGNGTGFGGW